MDLTFFNYDRAVAITYFRKNQNLTAFRVKPQMLWIISLLRGSWCVYLRRSVKNVIDNKIYLIHKVGKTKG